MKIKEVKRNNAFRNFLPYLILLIIIGVTFFILYLGTNKVNDLTTGELLEALAKNEVTEIVIMPKSNESVYYLTGKLKDYKENETFEAKAIEPQIEAIEEYIKVKEIKV